MFPGADPKCLQKNRPYLNTEVISHPREVVGHRIELINTMKMRCGCLQILFLFVNGEMLRFVSAKCEAHQEEKILKISFLRNEKSNAFNLEPSISQYHSFSGHIFSSVPDEDGLISTLVSVDCGGGELWFMSSHMVFAFKLSHLRNMQIRSVCFPEGRVPSTTENHYRIVLFIGTYSGSVLQICMEFSSLTHKLQQTFSRRLCEVSAVPIISIFQINEKFLSSVILVTQHSKVYEFFGRRLHDGGFSDMFPRDTKPLFEFPAWGTLSSTEIFLIKHQNLARFLVIRLNYGFVEIPIIEDYARRKSFLGPPKVVPFPFLDPHSSKLWAKLEGAPSFQAPSKLPQNLGKPQASLVSEHHYILQFDQIIVYIGRMTNEILHVSHFASRVYGEFRELSSSYVLSTSQIIVELTPSFEKENLPIWYLSLQKYEQALNVSNYPQERLTLIEQYVGHLLQTGQFKDAAQRIIQEKFDFQVAYIKLFRLDKAEKAGVLTLLLAKFRDATLNSPSKQVVLCVLILHVFFYQIHWFRAQPEELAQARLALASFVEDNPSIQQNPHFFERIFLENGSLQELSTFHASFRNVKQMVELEILQTEYLKALDLLKLHGPTRMEDPLLRFGRALCSRAPIAFVDYVMDLQGCFLEIQSFFGKRGLTEAGRYQKKLLSAEYLEDLDDFLFVCCRDPHESLLTPLLKRLSSEHVGDIRSLYYYADQAGNHITMSWAYLYLGQYQEAVDISLQQDDFGMAQMIVRQCPAAVNREVRRGLYRSLLAYIFEFKRDALSESAFQLVKGSNHSLTFKDVLEISEKFPEVPLPAAFHAEFLAFFETMENHILKLQAEVESYRQTSENLKIKLVEGQQRFDALAPKPHAFCACCGSTLLQGRKIVVFLCDHMFHLKCLRHALGTYLSADQMELLSQFETQRAQAEKYQAHDAVATFETQIEEIVSQDCLVCGELRLTSIYLPFLGSNDVEMEMWD